VGKYIIPIIRAVKINNSYRNINALRSYCTAAVIHILTFNKRMTKLTFGTSKI